MAITSHSVPNAILVYPHQFPNGGSSPRACDFDDLVQRLVKWHPSNHGITSTYSELVASRLAQLMEAPVLRGTVVYVERGLLPPEIACRITQEYHVGFTLVPGGNFSDTDYGEIHNRSALAAAAGFLAWLQIGDQESHNQYLLRMRRHLPGGTTEDMVRFLIIDLAAICGVHDWSAMPLDRHNTAHNLPGHLKSQITLPEVEPIINKIQSIDDSDILEFLEIIPESWGITPEMTDKLGRFLLARRAHLADILRSNLRP